MDKINDKIINIKVIGEKILCSNLFLDKKLPKVFKAKKTVIAHKITEKKFSEKLIGSMLE